MARAGDSAPYMEKPETSDQGHLRLSMSLKPKRAVDDWNVRTLLRLYGGASPIIHGQKASE